MAHRRLFIVFVLLFMIVATDNKVRAVDNSQNSLVYVGTYTGGDSQGIYTLRMDVDTGSLTQIGVTTGITDPSFLAIHPSQKFLYAVCKIAAADGQLSGGVSAFAIDSNSGDLRLLNRQLSGGAGPCHVVVEATGNNVLVANYAGGSVACLPINEDGSLSELSSFIQHEGSSVDPRRQTGPHAHSINMDPANRLAFAADLGLDKILIYSLDTAAGKLTPHDPPAVSVAPGAGPRHFHFHPGGKFAYVINELNLTVTAFGYDAERGVLSEIQTVSTIPDADRDQPGLSTAEVRVHPSGHFLYGSNRGHNTIVVFGIDQQTGKLEYIEHESTQGETPRNFFVDPSGRYLLAANQNTHTIVVFRINQDSGELDATGNVCEIPSPVCIRMLQD